MKKRNTTIFAFLLLAAVGMGVGYAAFSQEFNINGTAKVGITQADQEFQKEIIFTQAEAVLTKIDPSAQVSAEPTKVELDAAKHVATWTINDLQAKGDKCVGTFTVTNNSDLAAQIEQLNISNPDASLFSITVAGIANDDRLEAKNDGDTDEITFTVTVEMLKDPTATKDYTFNVKYTATLA